MEAKDIIKCYSLCKNAKILITHLNSYPHNKYTIETMKNFVEENKMRDRVIVPEDGEILKFQQSIDGIIIYNNLNLNNMV